MQQRFTNGHRFYDEDGQEYVLTQVGVNKFQLICTKSFNRKSDLIMVPSTGMDGPFGLTLEDLLRYNLNLYKLDGQPLGETCPHCGEIIPAEGE